jgi:hypothetical protein
MSLNWKGIPMSGNIQVLPVQRKFATNAVGKKWCSLWFMILMVSSSTMWSQWVELSMHSTTKHFWSIICIWQCDESICTSLLVLHDSACCPGPPRFLSVELCKSHQELLKGSSWYSSCCLQLLSVHKWHWYIVLQMD